MRALLPNTLSLSNLVLGFISTLMATQHIPGTNSEFLFWACILILVAALCDGFDGPTARLLKVKEGGMGEQLDSLADLTTFGIAPGFLMYQAVFYNYGGFQIFDIKFQYGMLMAAVFPVCAAYRLARFNISHDPNSFRGLPSPIAGLLIALYLLSQRGHYDSLTSSYITVVYGIVALLMVSTVKYSKPQRGVRSQFAPLRLFLLVILIGVLTLGLHFRFFEVLIFLTILYIFTGLAAFVILTIKKLRM